MKIENQLIATDLEIVKKDLLRMRGELGSGLGDLGRIRLKQVSAALLKIDKGSYGICEACAHSIPRARLIDKPYVRYCVSCF